MLTGNCSALFYTSIEWSISLFKDPWLKVMVARLNTAENTKPVKKKGQGVVQ